ncbi:hypothetical protein DL771_004079 [Monosporascus sp. 5C6A]|nr:hypothetical protein DL771_004079 [Monosporascus sp. 5C6A]
MSSRGVTVIIVNRSSHQLDLDPELTQLWRGKWDAAGSLAPEVIKPGESVLWRCKSARAAQGIEGSVTYHFAGHPPHDKVRFTWKNRYFGPNKYEAQTTREGYKIDVEGGKGAHAVVVFVFAAVNPAEEGDTARLAYHCLTIKFSPLSSITMGSASKVISVILRLGELLAAVVVMGLLGRFLYIVGEANSYADSRLIYTTVVSSVATFLSLVLLLPFTYSFMAFPVDFVMFALCSPVEAPVTQSGTGATGATIGAESGVVAMSSPALGILIGLAAHPGKQSVP